jgi:hypothetical protein
VFQGERLARLLALVAMGEVGLGLLLQEILGDALGGFLLQGTPARTRSMRPHKTDAILPPAGGRRAASNRAVEANASRSNRLFEPIDPATRRTYAPAPSA